MAYIEIPCELGDTVYEIIRPESENPYYISLIVCAIHISDRSRNSCQHTRESYIVARSLVTNSVKHYNVNKIGKTVFLSREEVAREIQRRTKNEDT